MGYLKEILAVCSTGIALFQLYFNGDGMIISAVIGFWGVLLGSEISSSQLDKVLEKLKVGAT